MMNGFAAGTVITQKEQVRKCPWILKILGACAV